ncbi:MAG: peptidoglycan bridge formation glycyltransferase FemA/FemB family protein [Chloroflexota bacterium]|nr:peptidoglycan bridge formation glycyltransferase FemA/FemB family protein [Chloroflexota bacterium]
MISRNTHGSETCDNARWDEALSRLDGDVLQSWGWGAFKQRHGWNVERIHVERPDGEALAQLLFRRKGPFSLGYLPRGPLILGGELTAAGLLDAINDTCARHRAITLVIEPDRPLPREWTDAGGPFTRGPEAFQTSRTIKIPIADDAQLLSRMRKDTRYNITYAQRHGIVVEAAPAEPAAITAFYDLLVQTSERNGFGIHGRGYYDDFLRIFGDQAVLLFSRFEGVPTAALIAVRNGDEGRSMYAGSSIVHRRRGDAALLRFEAMRWARNHGCSRFDLGGIASGTAPSAQNEDDDKERWRSHLAGVHQFKVGFGGEIVTFPPTVERRYHPGLAWLVRRVNARFRTARIRDSQRWQSPGSNETD